MRRRRLLQLTWLEFVFIESPAKHFRWVELGVLGWYCYCYCLLLLCVFYSFTEASERWTRETRSRATCFFRSKARHRRCARIGFRWLAESSCAKIKRSSKDENRIVCSSTTYLKLNQSFDKIRVSARRALRLKLESDSKIEILDAVATNYRFNDRSTMMVVDKSKQSFTQE